MIVNLNDKNQLSCHNYRETIETNPPGIIKELHDDTQTVIICVFCNRVEFR